MTKKISFDQYMTKKCFLIDYFSKAWYRNSCKDLKEYKLSYSSLQKERKSSRQCEQSIKKSSKIKGLRYLKLRTTTNLQQFYNA